VLGRPKTQKYKLFQWINYGLIIDELGKRKCGLGLAWGILADYEQLSGNF